jgi:acyl-CoA synthetase (AMP-forming)/AMP-acid ligase II
MYGQTEATARLAYLPPERGEEKLGSMGIAIPGVELRVVDDAGRELPTGETGNLVARGDNVTLGYLDEPEETAAILHDGWLWTGDLASRDADGFFFHRGRSKEILKIGGHRVSPIEIEHAVARHPDMHQCADDGLFDAVHVLFDEVAPATQVQQGVGHHLAGAVVGDLSTAVAGDDRDIAGCQHMARLGMHAQGVDRRMLDEPQRIRRMGVALVGVLAHRLPHRRIGRQSPIPDFRWWC